MTRAQREVFDEVAGAYQRARPGYPPRLVSDVLAFARLEPGERILEIGAGTGKATTAFAGRGFPILCVESGPRLAAILEQQVRAQPDVEVAVTRFEECALEPCDFGLAIAAQSFHWVDPETGLARCAEALRPGGTLALFGNRPKRGETALHRAVEACYARHATGLAAAALRGQSRRDYRAELEAAPGFGDLSEARYPFHRRYDARLYLDLLSTQSDHRMLDPAVRASLLASIRSVLLEHGGSIRVDYEAMLVLARRR